MKAAFVAYFFFIVALWVGVGFFGGDISLTGMWLAAVPLLFAAGLLRFGSAKLPRGGARVALILISLLFAWSLLSAVSGVARFGFEGSWLLSFVVPLGIFILAAWSLVFDTSFEGVSRMMRVWEIILFIDVVLTFVQFFGTLLGWIDPIIFFQNTRYTVIYKPLLGEAVVRSPGIFESGATNGAFIGVGAIWLLVSHRYSLFGRPKANLWKFVLLFLALVITFTRRDLISILVVVGLWCVMEVMKRRLLPILAGVLAVVGGVTYSIFHYRDLLGSYFSDSSLFDRFSYWSSALDMLNRHPESLLVGFGVIQSALTQSDYASGGRYGALAVLDQMYLSWLIYGGVVFVLLMAALFIQTALSGLRMFLRGQSETVIGGGAFIFLSVTYFCVVGAFGTFWANLPESFVMWVIVLSMFAFLSDRANLSRRPLNGSP